MSEKGQVVSRDGDMITVRMTRSEACAKCRACIEGMTSKDMMINAVNACDAAVDDWVGVELEESGFIRAVMIMYGIPFVGMFAGFVAGYYLSEYLAGRALLRLNSEASGFLLGILLMLLSFLIIRLRKGKWNENRYTPIAREKM